MVLDIYKTFYAKKKPKKSRKNQKNREKNRCKIEKYREYIINFGVFWSIFDRKKGEKSRKRHEFRLFRVAAEP